MAFIGGALIFVGFMIAMVYGIQILILAFKESVLWGLGSIFVPFVGLIFVIMFWDRAKGPFLKGLIAIPFYAIGTALVVSGIDTGNLQSGF